MPFLRRLFNGSCCRKYARCQILWARFLTARNSMLLLKFDRRSDFLLVLWVQGKQSDFTFIGSYQFGFFHWQDPCWDYLLLESFPVKTRLWPFSFRDTDDFVCIDLSGRQLSLSDLGFGLWWFIHRSFTIRYSDRRTARLDSYSVCLALNSFHHG